MTCRSALLCGLLLSFSGTSCSVPPPSVQWRSLGPLALAEAARVAARYGERGSRGPRRPSLPLLQWGRLTVTTAGRARWARPTEDSRAPAEPGGADDDGVRWGLRVRADRDMLYFEVRFRF